MWLDHRGNKKEQNLGNLVRKSEGMYMIVAALDMLLLIIFIFNLIQRKIMYDLQ